MTNKQKINNLVNLINNKLGNGAFVAECVSHYGGWRLESNRDVNRPIIHNTELEYYCMRRLRCCSKEFIAFLEGLYYALTYKNQ